eukprot:CAMPEP_0119348106 /NCGR_PEP_ID=MMETSP1333-20130426/108871_1 /TAXON_ID=418940 /ORGANISM="Scyphosphaera apsteinii, Strain RCC1455" /LENGTH=43 /DNA_ID= /DNA_START= /DNA_END= /DNA_ORIENTATION=
MANGRWQIQRGRWSVTDGDSVADGAQQLERVDGAWQMIVADAT